MKKRDTRVRDRKAYFKAYYQNLKIVALGYYSGGVPVCKCCGEESLEFLTIDHLNGDGKEHRKQLRGNNIYKWLIDHKYPKGFQVLCMNCNFAMGKFGYCPHKLAWKKG